MPAAVPLSSFSYVPETKVELEWADLETIDLSNFDDPKERKRLATQLINAVRTKGFLYVKGWKGISSERVDRQFAIGQSFYELPLEEKSKYIPNLDAGEYNGYRPAGRRIVNEATGIRDRTEVYNIPKFNGFFPREHPAPVAENIGEIEQFARDLHTHILDPLFILFAIALELPENYFTDQHKYEEKSEDHLRYMKYSKYSPEETELLGDGLWSRGHTDLGSITLLFRQPVAALQIQDRETGKWSWVKPQDGTLTVNTCDALSFLTGGYVRSTIHRVSVPPADQRNVDRLGLLYFARPHNNIHLNSIKDSPVLQREGFTTNELEKAGEVPTMEEWTFKKQTWQQSSGGYKHNATIVPGFTEKLYA
ncbi:Clavaminate synthase-like protein [Meredithblackwellia eburnea MCA 4105]